MWRPGAGGFDEAVSLLAAEEGNRGCWWRLHFPGKAKRVIYLFMAGGPSQIETFDYKPVLNRLNGEQLPASVRQGQRLTGMSGNQSSLPLAGSRFKFARHGRSGPGRVVAAHGHGRGRRVHRAVPLYRGHQSQLAITFLQTGSKCRAAEARGCITDWAATTRIRRRSSC